MSNRIFKWMALGIVILLSMGVYYKVTSAEGEQTGGEFVVKLTEAMDIDSSGTISDCINSLEKIGFVFQAGFDPQKPITKEQSAELLSQALNIDDARNKQMQMEVYRDKAVIEKLVGNVTVKREATDKWISADLGMKLTEGDCLKTGPNSTAFLKVGVAGRIEVRENSELQLKDLSTQVNKKSENILLYLAMGEMSVDVRFIHKDTIFETQTPTTLAAVRGTIYTVKVLPIEGKTEIREER